MRLSAGARLGPYEILAPLGAGDPLIRHLGVAGGAPALREGSANHLAALAPQHLCPLRRWRSTRSRVLNPPAYLVMELLDGETLAQRLTRGPLPLELTLRYAVQIADAIDKAHRHGIVHRDLKPANVMVARTGVKLLNFGLAVRINRPLCPADLGR